MSTFKVGLVAWGRRGASVRLLTTTMKLLAEQELSSCISVGSRSEYLQLAAVNSPAVVVDVPFLRPAALLDFRGAHRASLDTVRTFREQGVNRVVILVPHPWDLALTTVSHSQGLEVLQIIHDARRHPGDPWPPRRAIVRRVKSADVIVCLSSHVASWASKYSSAVRQAPHPALIEGLPHKSQVQGDAPRQVLFLGRIRKYKGLELLLDAWTLLDTNDATLVIAGAGTLPRGRIPDKCRVINRWLSDEEIDRLVQSADVLVCPYTEASQSGVIPLAVAAGVPVVATPVGGLAEQFDVGVEGVLADACTPEALANAIDSAMHLRPPTPSMHSANMTYISALTT